MWLEIHADDVDILARFFHLPTSAAKRNVQIRFYPYTLELKHPFTVAVNSRTTTPLMLVEIEQGGFVGYGEASMPPYLGESDETATASLFRVSL